MTEAHIEAQAIKVAALALVVILLSGMTYQRNLVWHTLIALWQDTAARSPLKSRVHNNLGNSYMLSHKTFQAIAEYRKAIALDANNIEAYYNLAWNLENVGIMNQARYYYDIFCRTAPSDYDIQKKAACERVAVLSHAVKGSGR